MNPRRVAGAGLLAAALAGALWYFATRRADDGGSPPAAPVTAASAPPAADAASALAGASAAAAGGPASAPAVTSVGAQARASAAASAAGAGHGRPGGPSSWELCGLGPVPAPPGASRPEGELPELPAPLGRDALEAARERTLAALRQGDLRARAAAQLLRPEPAAAPEAEALRRGTDAVALLWARARCPPDAEGAACRLALAQAAARAEPANAEPWAQVAADDPAQADVAWHRILQAERWDSHFGAFTASVLAAVPADVPAYLRMMLAVESFGIESTLPMPPLAPLLRRCSPGAAGGAASAAASAAECDHLAQLLTERSDTLLLAGMGRRVAEGAGWPPERLAALDRELQTLRARTAALEPDPQQPLGCASTQAFLGYLRQLPQGGEMAALRALARSAPR